MNSPGLMVSIGQRAGRRVTALITAMEQPLGRAVGNILEVREAIDALHGRGPRDFQLLTEAVAAEMLLLGDPRLQRKMAEGNEKAALDLARRRCAEAIESGAAFAKFVEFVAAQGGDPDRVVDPGRLDIAPVALDATARRDGVIRALDARAVGLAVVALGGGRQRKGDVIDPRVGVVLQAKAGSRVRAGYPLFTVHAADEDAAQRAAAQIQEAYSFADNASEAPPPASREAPIVLERVTS